MFRFITICALAAIAAAAPSPGFIEHHHGVLAAPVVAKVGAVVHSAPVATSHQSFTQVHNHAVITPVVKHVAPVVPVVSHVEPVVPVVKHIAPVVPVVKHIAPVVPVVKHIAPVVPVVKTVVPAVPVVHHHAYVAPSVSHQSHTQIHQKTAVITASAPVIKTIVAPVAVVATPFTHAYHHHH
ncbi:max-binding protein MNT [Drosophila tropicalis]|uniref:max-binding protein MNT n=1 Tax=Drosophila tropicalis TaxID=46794 RepID=UPI0035ABE62A